MENVVLGGRTHVWSPEGRETQLPENCWGRSSLTTLLQSHPPAACAPAHNMYVSRNKTDPRFLSVHLYSRRVYAEEEHLVASGASLEVARGEDLFPGEL